MPPWRSATPSSTELTASQRAPSRYQNARDLQRAVAIGIRFDHAGDLDARTHHRADIAVIAGDLLARDQHIRAVRSGH